MWQWSLNRDLFIFFLENLLHKELILIIVGRKPLLFALLSLIKDGFCKVHLLPWSLFIRRVVLPDVLEDWLSMLNEFPSAISNVFLPERQMLARLSIMFRKKGAIVWRYFVTISLTSPVMRFVQVYYIPRILLRDVVKYFNSCEELNPFCFLLKTLGI